jgi:biopolymer transport protein ExbB
LTLLLERSLFWGRVGAAQERAIATLLEYYPQDLVGARLRLRQQVELPIARIYLAALELEQPSPDSFRLAIATALAAERPRLRRFDTALQTITAIAPLLGLLGTILGLIDAFANLAPGDLLQSDRTAVTLGVSQALISTVLGLLVALVALVGGNWARSRYRRLLHRIQAIADELERRLRHQTSLAQRPNPRR